METQERDEIKALLIQMRRYFIQHNCAVGECVAWDELKRMFGVGRSDFEDETWMREYSGKPFTLYGEPYPRSRRR